MWPFKIDADGNGKQLIDILMMTLYMKWNTLFVQSTISMYGMLMQGGLRRAPGNRSSEIKFWGILAFLIFICALISKVKGYFD